MKKLSLTLIVLVIFFIFVSCNGSTPSSTYEELSNSEKTNYAETTIKDTTYVTSDKESSSFEETLSETTETTKSVQATKTTKSAQATKTTKTVQTTKTTKSAQTTKTTKAAKTTEATKVAQTTKKHTTTTTQKKASMTVYRTPYGKRYHRLSTCGGKNSYAISIDDVGSLTPCQKCW